MSLDRWDIRSIELEDCVPFTEPDSEAEDNIPYTRFPEGYNDFKDFKDNFDDLI